MYFWQTPEFAEFPSSARLSKDCVVTEKIDGTNAQVHITEDGRMFAGVEGLEGVVGASVVGGWVGEDVAYAAQVRDKRVIDC